VPYKTFHIQYIDGRRLSSDELSEDERDELLAIREVNELRSIRDRWRAATREQTEYVVTQHPSPDVRKTAQSAHTMVCADLKLAKVPDLVFCRELTGDEIKTLQRVGWSKFCDWFGGGRCLCVQNLRASKDITGVYVESRGEWPVTWVLADLSLTETLRTVVHEAAHAAGLDEADAQAFEAKWAALLGLDETEEVSV
jgi:hypothetical protein